jgi:hypothetical protein
VKRVYCISEDREAEENGVRLVVASLRRHCHDATIVVYRERPRDAFAKWLRALPNVTLVPNRPRDAQSWNCKPHSLIPALEAGASEAVWLDSDILVTRDFGGVFDDAGPETLVAALEPRNTPNQGTGPRTRAWGLPAGRSFCRSPNSCILRVTPAHLPLLRRWKELLENPAYAAWQVRALHERPLHMWGDQDVLGALLGSAEFAGVPVRLLETGREVIHCSSPTSFPLGERLDSLRRPPPLLIHAQGAKPWVVLREGDGPVGFREALLRLFHETSPYTVAARAYRQALGDLGGWLDRRTTAGRLIAALGSGRPALEGWPMTLLAELAKGLGR